MKGVLFKPLVWEGKQKALNTYGMAVTRRLDNLQIINREPNRYKLTEPFVIASDGSFHWADLSLVGAPASCGSGNIFCKPPFHAGQIVYTKESYQTFKKDTEEESAIRFKAGQNIKSVEDLMRWSELPSGHGQIGILYKSDFGEWANNPDSDLRPWSSPMFMPEKFARTFLKIKYVRPERLHAITEDDALLEGVSQSMASYLGLSTNSASEEEFNLRHARRTYQFLWDSLGKKVKTTGSDFIPYQNSWVSNPFVWRIELERVAK